VRDDADRLRRAAWGIRLDLGRGLFLPAVTGLEQNCVQAENEGWVIRAVRVMHCCVCSRQAVPGCAKVQVCVSRRCSSAPAFLGRAALLRLLSSHPARLPPWQAVVACLAALALTCGPWTPAA